MIHAALSLAILAAVLFAQTSSASPTWDDEPDQLSWELCSQDQVLLHHFLDWAATNPPPSGIESREPVPDTVPAVWFKPAELPALEPHKSWYVDTREGPDAFRHYHNVSVLASRPLRLVIDVPVSGTYRLWMRYRHEKGRIEPLRVRLSRAPEGLLRDDTGGASFPLLEQVFSRAQEFPCSNGNRPFDPIPTSAVLPTPKGRYRWEGTHKTAYLEKGRYLLTFSGGSFGSMNHRVITDLLLAADPFYAPPDTLTKKAAAVESLPASAEYRAPLYALRPGGQTNAPQELVSWWRAWRRSLLDDLAAREHSDDYDWGYLASLVYFDEETNLIGRPSEIAAAKRYDALPPATFSLYGRDFATEGPWTIGQVPFKTNLTDRYYYAYDGSSAVISKAGASGGARATVAVPEKGRYVLWVLVAKSPFQPQRIQPLRLSVANAGRTVLDRTIADRVDDRQLFHWLWMPLLDLEKGPAEIAFSLPPGTATGADCHVCRVVLTGRTDFNPKREIEFPGPASSITEDGRLHFWRADPFGAFTRHSTPGVWKGLGLVSQLGTIGLHRAAAYAWAPLPEGELDKAAHEISVASGDVASEMLILRNESPHPVVFSPEVESPLKATVRVVASILNSNGTWVPKILLERREIYATPGQNTGLWLSIDTAGAEPGSYPVKLRFADREVMWKVAVGPPHRSPAPWMNPWTRPLRRESAYAAYRDLGMNMMAYDEVPKATTAKYGIRLMQGLPFDKVLWTEEGIRSVVARERELFGREPQDYCLYIMDEPMRDEIPLWMEQVALVKKADPRLQIWYNSAFFPTNAADFAELRPYMETWDIVCSFCNCFTAKAEERAPMMADYKALGKLKLVYNTFDTGNCENYPDSPMQVLRFADFARREGRDGWSPHNLGHGWPYDDAYCSNNTIFLYPGAHLATLSTRGAEAVREANQRWRTAKDAEEETGGLK